MTSTNKIKIMTTAALLCSIGIAIPMYSPFKIIIEPASFTLGSHVAVIIAMFISPIVGISVALVTSFGFLLGPFPIVVVLRALSHVIFITLGAYLLKRRQNLLLSYKTMIPFALLISTIHAVCEVFVSSIFYFSGTTTTSYMVSVIGLVGVGTLIHSMFDFFIATLVWRPIQHVISIPANAKIKTRA